MRVTTWKAVGLTAVVVTVGSALIFTGKLAGVTGPGEPQALSSIPDGCKPGGSDDRHASLIAEGKSLTYGSAATQTLWWPGPGGKKVRGPEAKIWSAENSTDSLDDAGRIVARIWIEFGHGRRGYPTLTLPEGTSWVKICKTTMPEKLWALIIPLDQSVPLKPHPQVDRNNDREPARGPMAQWEYVPEDDHACFTCGGYWCRMR